MGVGVVGALTGLIGGLDDGHIEQHDVRDDHAPHVADRDRQPARRR
jgi:hypothetical protein